MRRLKTVCALGLLALGAGCAAPAPNATLGKPPADAPVVAVRDLKPAASVEVEGTMVEKCPVAGCWFYVQDKTGRVRVDTKSAGFVVTEVPLKTKVRVAGSFRDGDEPTLHATGIRY